MTAYTAVTPFCLFSEYLEKSESDLVMNSSENYRRIQEERTLIDRSLPALYPGKVVVPQWLVLFTRTFSSGLG